jgi:hypothetical protein
MFTVSGERTKWVCTVGSRDKGHDRWVCADSARRERLRIFYYWVRWALNET